LVTVGFFLGSPTSSRTGAIAIGIASSLFASLAFNMFDGLLAGSRRLELRDQLEHAARLTHELSLVREAERHQIEVVKPKGEYDREEWLAILKEAECLLTMVGHALDKWCEEGIEEVFCETIRRVVARGGQVRLVMLAESASRVSTLRDKGYAKRIQRTLRVLAKLNGELDGPGRLSVYHLGDKLDMPYMAVANDSVMVTAPYPATAQSSNGMPAVRLACNSSIAQRLQADIDELLEGQVTLAKL
jgi:hypothetical protein